MNKKLQLFVLQSACHLALVWALFNFTGWEWFTSIFVYFLTGCLGVSITLHRFYSHKSFEFKYKWLERFCTLCSAYGLVGDPIAWVNNHRQHHRLTDKPGDPHSPVQYGFVQVQWLSMFYSYDKLRYVPNMIRDSFLVNLNKNYYRFHWIFMTLFLLINWKLALVCYMVPAAILWNMGSFINSISHSKFGYRNHETTDQSVNNIILGFIVWGEGWHNNHHNLPSARNFGEKWFEFDLSNFILKGLAK